MPIYASRDWHPAITSHFKAYGERECLGLLKEVRPSHAVIERYRISWLWGLMTARVVKHAA